MTRIESTAVLGVRVVAVLLLFFVLSREAVFLANGLQGFEPTYWVEFGKQFLPGVAEAVVGVSVWVLARPLGRLVARGLENGQG